jgi:hypothetical protein
MELKGAIDVSTASKIFGRLTLAAALPLAIMIGGKGPDWVVVCVAIAAVAVVFAAQIIERREHRGRDGTT